MKKAFLGKRGRPFLALLAGLGFFVWAIGEAFAIARGGPQ